MSIEKKDASGFSLRPRQRISPEFSRLEPNQRKTHYERVDQCINSDGLESSVRSFQPQHGVLSFVRAQSAITAMRTQKGVEDNRRGVLSHFTALP